ncbi:DgyrCDS11276 [Dimorphilus gyrociliatus]|uniref:Serine-threonine kinase receptor-associated protein n=1 Tax=Dimorphilus gyrociliatus TaxID=2664684 RepID=A0A7I8W448_9ANNE|nr:DgyrCDS11276 [Dimorphilus gyrociliatus]
MPQVNFRQVPLTCSGHTRPVVDMDFSDITEHGYFIISACKDGKPMLRQGETGDWIGTFEGHKGAVWSVSLNSEATKAASGAADFEAKIWDAISGDKLMSFSHKHIVKAVDFSNDSQKLLTGSNEKLLRIFDLNNTDSEPFLFSGHTDLIRNSVFCPDENFIISSSDDKTIRLWDRRTGHVCKEVELPDIPMSIEISVDGTLLTVGHGRKISFYSMDSLNLDKEFTAEAEIISASLHPSKSCAVCGGQNFTLYKYDFETGVMSESYKGHFGPVHCIKFSPDGELYASGSEDGTLRLWQTTPGKTYGLWKAEGEEIEESEITPVENGDQ